MTSELPTRLAAPTERAEATFTGRLCNGWRLYSDGSARLPATAWQRFVAAMRCRRGHDVRPTASPLPIPFHLGRYECARCHQDFGEL